MVKGSERLSYLTYRCYRCGRLITKLEILKRWQDAEENSVKTLMGLCPCGSRHIVPSSPKLWEEFFLPRVWVLWWKEVRGQRDRYTDTGKYVQETPWQEIKRRFKSLVK